jgi:hypothetical protein
MIGRPVLLSDDRTARGGIADRSVIPPTTNDFDQPPINRTLGLTVYFWPHSARSIRLIP